MSSVQQSYTDPTLGCIRIKVHARAKHVIMYPEVDGIKVTAPPHTSIEEIKKSVERFRSELLRRQAIIRKEKSATRIDSHYRLRTELLEISVVTGTCPQFLLDTQPGKVTIICPPETDFSTEACQEWLRKVIVKQLREQGALLLPERLRRLSQEKGLPFGICKITTSRSQWGSCSSMGDICLSCYLLTLPIRLIEYVMLHELCHTREMNHSPRFWKLLDQLTGEDSHALRKELRTYRTDIQYTTNGDI